MYHILSDSKKFVKSSIVNEKHLNFIIGIEKELTNLLKELNVSETISEIDYKKRKPKVSVLVFYMASAKLINRSMTNVHHLDLFLQQLELPLRLYQNF